MGKQNTNILDNSTITTHYRIQTNKNEIILSILHYVQHKVCSGKWTSVALEESAANKKQV